MVREDAEKVIQGNSHGGHETAAIVGSGGWVILSRIDLQPETDLVNLEKIQLEADKLAGTGKFALPLSGGEVARKMSSVIEKCKALTFFAHLGILNTLASHYVCALLKLRS